VSSSQAVPLEDQPLYHPGHSKGLLEIPKYRYLLDLLVHKELRVRYRGSVLGMLWSYVKPAFQLLVFYVAMGMFLGLNRGMNNYVIYLFSGMVVINFFNEVLFQNTHSITGNGSLVGKIYLPRELFPVSSMIVAFIHFIPQVVVLLIGALFFGWVPTRSGLLAFVGATLIVIAFSLGMGLMFAAWNVLFRDAQNFIELISMTAMWLSPVFYRTEMVKDVIPPDWDWLWWIYQANPLAIATELYHFVFWGRTTGVEPYSGFLENWQIQTAIAAVISLLVLLLGQLVFKHHEAKFAEEL
jgi:ABC-2 type transport system permease protein